MGRRRWGGLIRYIPYPVIGGFIGSVGWLLVVGGVGVSTGHPFDLLHAGPWVVAHADLRLAAGLATGVVIWWSMQRWQHPLSLPALIVGCGAAVHLGLWLGGIDLGQARERGWLLEGVARALPLWPGTLLATVDWLAVAHQAGLMFSAVVVATIAMLLSDSSLEVAWDVRADIDRDLRVIGQANVLSVALGGLSGGVSISRSVLNKAAGAATRFSGHAKGVLCLVVMLWGGPVIGLLPRPLLGGLLVYLGLGMLKTWLVDGRRLARTDHAVIVAMVSVTALVGFLAAVCVGVVACCVQFAVSSSQLQPVRRMISRSAWPDRVERHASQATHLLQQGERLRILELQGVLFFGSTTGLSEQVDALLRSAPLPERLLFDFKHVQGLDSSAAQALARLFKLAQRSGVGIDASGMAAPVQAELQRAGAFAGGARRYADLDAALAAWDEAQLEALASVDAWPAELFGSASEAERAFAHFETRRLAVGDLLFAQGDAPDALYLLRAGLLTAHVKRGGREVWVRSIHPGGSVGEMGLFRGQPRSATVRADAPSLVLRLSEAQWAELRRTEPELAARLDRHFLTLMAARIDQLTAQAHELSR